MSMFIEFDGYNIIASENFTDIVPPYFRPRFLAAKHML